jgi:hypothetical protein
MLSFFSKVQVVKNEEKKAFLHMVAHENLLCHLKPNSDMLTNVLYLFSSLGWMKKENVLKIIVRS